MTFLSGGSATSPADPQHLRIGSLCTGTGALDMAVMEVVGGSMAWHCQYEPPNKDGKEDRWQYAARILAHHWPAVPNHGDITKVDWSQVEGVDVLTAGFPCTDVSLIGQRAGIAEGTRSGMWLYVATAIRVLRPRLVVIENVEGLRSARADSDVEPCPWCLGDVEGQPVLRALGAVLGDLAGLGFDAEWVSVKASDTGACHQRTRVFILAWPTASDPAGVGYERPRDARDGRDGSPDRRVLTADPHGPRLEVRPVEHHGSQLPAPERGRGECDPAGFKWGRYEPAIRRHERTFGRPAPRPTQPGRTGEQLSPALVEWMMGLPKGHITGVPRPAGMSAAAYRNAQIKAGGNGVVPRQAAHALRLLLDRSGLREVA